MNDWRDLFPLDAEPRDGQKRVIDEVLESFTSGKTDSYCLNLPTGSGKSAIAVTIARWMAKNFPANDDFETGAWIYVTQKVLQKQYLRDFAPERFGGMLELMSSTNYACGYDHRQSCGESKRALKALGTAADGSDWKRSCTHDCVYSLAKKNFLQAPLSITNYSYGFAKAVYSPELKPRQLIVCDEAHAVEEELTKFVKVELSDRFCTKHLGLPLVRGEDPDTIRKWIEKRYKPALLRKIESVKAELNAFGTSNLFSSAMANDVFKTSVKQNDLLDKHICKINRLLDRFDPSTWIVDRENKRTSHGTAQTLVLKPIEAATWAEPYLLKFGEKQLFMSATILDKKTFCRSLGLDESRVGYVELPSTFPVQNRPIHYMPVGKMSKNEIETTLPKLAKAVKEILAAHATEKGIIHTVSFKVANYLRDTLKDPRLLVHSSEDREAVLRKHTESKEPTVLLSPSMTEGIDLAEDLARFQIFAKVPYPNLGDKGIRKRIERDPTYFDYLTTRSFVQGLGRGVRSETDTCVSYLLDECFSSFKRKNRDIIPRYVLEAMG